MALQPLPLRHVPSGHSTLKQACCALSPGPEYLFSSTPVQLRSAAVVHAVASRSPAPQLMHRMQALLFWAAAKVTPSMQASGCHAPLVQALPAGHAEHSACDVMFSRAPKEPAWHGNGCTLPSAQ